MIDNQAKVTELMAKMEAHLPIPAFPKKPLVQTLRQEGTKVTPQQMLSIERVVYLGDEGGIGCALDKVNAEDEVFVCSLTHLSLSPRHPLAREIHAYQRERRIKLAQQDSFRLR